MKLVFIKLKKKMKKNSGSKKTSITALRLHLEPVIYKSKLLFSKRFASLVFDAFLKPFEKYVVFLDINQIIPINLRIVLFLLGFITMITGCDETYYPKPKGYLRIDLPKKEYIRFDTTFPYTFEYPVYANLVPDKSEDAEPYWINMEFPGFKGRVYLSYKKVDNDLSRFIEDSRKLVMKHIPKASSIEQKAYENSDTRVYGLTYTISGSDAASPFQFYLTDSTSHFLRGALYFNTIPNNDSLAPVINFIEEDIQHLIESFRWK